MLVLLEKWRNGWRIASHISGQKELKREGRTATEARRNGVATARECLPDVEERGSASEGNAGGGRRDRATRGEGEHEVDGGDLHGGGRGGLHRRQKEAEQGSRGQKGLRGRR
jgi:hypothetical protein